MECTIRALSTVAHRLTVFPADPVSAYVAKGELKPRYFNPQGLFGSLQVISPVSVEADLHHIQFLAGAADVDLVTSGWLDRMSWRRFAGLRRFLDREFERVFPRVATFDPQVVRAYTPQLQGWLAMKCAQRLRVPLVVSVHANFDYDVRADALRRREFRLYASNWLQERLVERDTLRSADLVIAAYEWPARYARRMGARRVEVVYNRVDTTRFEPSSARPPSRFTVLSVGRLLPERNPQALVRAMVGFDGDLHLVGDGPLLGPLRRLARSLGVADRVRFTPRVPNAEIHHTYAQAHAYAHATRYGGVHIPIIEAMAAGLPLVVPQPRWEASPELVSDIALVVPNEPAGFRDAFLCLKRDEPLRRELGERGRRRALEVDGSKMEAREAELYRSLFAPPSAP